jgi:uncharacterized Zn finger protein (UPF0148 family)
MEIRGERECSACGRRWSYYETGSVTCPECGSHRSVGVGERAEHTTGPAEFDLTAVREAVDGESLPAVAEMAAERGADYVRQAGFVHAGDLQALDDDYLVAAELRRVGTTLARRLRIDEDEELYFLTLLRGGDQGQRPPPADVPSSLRAERGLAVAAATDAYVSDLRRVLGEPEPAVGGVLSRLRAHRKRIEALDGDVDPDDSERIVRAVRELGDYLIAGDETALARARSRLPAVE